MASISIRVPAEACEAAALAADCGDSAAMSSGSPSPWLGSAAAVAVIENLHEMESAAARAKAAGFDYVSFKPFLTRAEAGGELGRLRLEVVEAS